MLVQRHHETVVRGGAVVAQGAGEIKPDDLLQGVGTILRVDGITGGLRTDPRVKPDRSACVTPARFVGRDHRSVLDRLPDFGIRRFEFAGGP